MQEILTSYYMAAIIEIALNLIETKNIDISTAVNYAVDSYVVEWDLLDCGIIIEIFIKTNRQMAKAWSTEILSRPGVRDILR